MLCPLFLSRCLHQSQFLLKMPPSLVKGKLMEVDISLSASYSCFLVLTHVLGLFPGKLFHTALFNIALFCSDLFSAMRAKVPAWISNLIARAWANCLYCDAVKYSLLKLTSALCIKLFSYVNWNLSYFEVTSSSDIATQVRGKYGSWKGKDTQLDLYFRNYTR